MTNAAVLVLNRHYQPIHVTNVRRAFSLLYLGVARVVDPEFKTFDFESWAQLSARSVRRRRRRHPHGQPRHPHPARHRAAALRPHPQDQGAVLAPQHLHARRQHLPVLRRGAAARRPEPRPRRAARPGRAHDLGERRLLLHRLQPVEGGAHARAGRASSCSRRRCARAGRRPSAPTAARSATASGSPSWAWPTRRTGTSSSKTSPWTLAGTTTTEADRRHRGDGADRRRGSSRRRRRPRSRRRPRRSARARGRAGRGRPRAERAGPEPSEPVGAALARAPHRLRRRGAAGRAARCWPPTSPSTWRRRRRRSSPSTPIRRAARCTSCSGAARPPRGFGEFLRGKAERPQRADRRHADRRRRPHRRRGEHLRRLAPQADRQGDAGRHRRAGRRLRGRRSRAGRFDADASTCGWAADVPVLVTLPDPASIDATYRFAKSAFVRRLRTMRGLDRLVGNPHGPAAARRSISTAPSRQARRTDGEAGAGDPALPADASWSTRRARVQDLKLGNWMRRGGAAAARARVRLPRPRRVGRDGLAGGAAPPLAGRRVPRGQGLEEHRAPRRGACCRWRTSASAPATTPLRLEEEQTYYEILETEPGVSDEEVRRAYRAIKDIYASGSLVISGLYEEHELADLHARVNAAHDTLFAPDRRRLYDLALPEADLARAVRAAASAGRRAPAPLGPPPRSGSRRSEARDRPGRRDHRRSSCARSARRAASSSATSRSGPRSASATCAPSRRSASPTCRPPSTCAAT